MTHKKIGKLVLAEKSDVRQAADQLGFDRPEDVVGWLFPATR